MFAARVEAIRDRFGERAKQRWWLWLVVVLLAEGLRDRVGGTANRVIDDLGWPALLGEVFRPLVFPGLVLAIALAVVLAFAYRDTRPSGQTARVRQESGEPSDLAAGKGLYSAAKNEMRRAQQAERHANEMREASQGQMERWEGTAKELQGTNRRIRKELAEARERLAARERDYSAAIERETSLKAALAEARGKGGMAAVVVTQPAAVVDHRGNDARNARTEVEGLIADGERLAQRIRGLELEVDEPEPSPESESGILVAEAREWLLLAREVEEYWFAPEVGLASLARLGSFSAGVSVVPVRQPRWRQELVLATEERVTALRKRLSDSA